MSRAEIRAIIERDRPRPTDSSQITRELDQLWNFVAIMNIDDEVLMPEKGGRQVHVGVVAGLYHWVEGMPLPLRRDVEWTDRMRPFPSSVSRYNHNTVILVRV